MSNPNPLVPQGSLLEQQAKSKSTFQVAAFIVALHVVILGGLLFLGCKKEEKLSEQPSVDSLIPPPAIGENPDALPADPFAMPTNAMAVVPDLGIGVAPGITDPAAQPVFPAQPAFPGTATDTTLAPGMGSSEYVVQKGDVAYHIARKQGVTLKQLQDANPGTDLARIRVNQKIQIPSPAGTATASSPGAISSPAGASTEGTQAVYTVKGGDNLSRLSKKYGVSVKEIRNANGLKSNDIKVGQKLRIPVAAGGAGIPAADASSIPSVTPAQPVRP